MHSGYVEHVVRSEKTASCSGKELERSSSQLKVMFKVTKSLLARKGTILDVAQWMMYRKGLKSELSTSRCTVKRGRFCCHVCVSGSLSMFCSHERLLTASESSLSNRVRRPKSPITYNSFITTNEVTIDLFAQTCDKPMSEQICSEFCCDPMMRGKLSALRAQPGSD